MDIRGLLPGTYIIAVDAGSAGGADIFDLVATVTTGELAPGDLIINEAMIDFQVTDSNGEHVELTNPRSFFVATGDLRLQSDTNGAPNIVSPGTGLQLVVAPGGFLLGTINPDTAINGNLIPDFDF